MVNCKVRKLRNVEIVNGDVRNCEMVNGEVRNGEMVQGDMSNGKMGRYDTGFDHFPKKNWKEKDKMMTR